MINKNSKIFVAGHNGLVGSAIVKKLKQKGYKKILTVEKSSLDLTNQSKVYNYLKKKVQNLFLLLQQKLGEFILIINIRLILFTIICQFKTTLFIRHISVKLKI